MLYVDLHGHSRMLDSCMYGNKVTEYMVRNQYRPALLPYLLSTQSSNFSFDKCTFKTGKNKDGTGRVVAFKECNIMDSFTLECSLAGATVLHVAESMPNVAVCKKVV